MGRSVYIHYGSRKYDPMRFTAIRNQPGLTKPLGGLWASDVDARYGWKQWCADNDYGSCDDTEAFCFTLAESARVLTITAKDQLASLPHAKTLLLSHWECLDFELLANEYDAVETLISSDRRLYHLLYGWDCDSIVVLNPDVIVPSKWDGHVPLADFFAQPDPYCDQPDCPFDLSKLLAYAKEKGKRVAELTYDEVRQFEVEQ